MFFRPGNIGHLGRIGLVAANTTSIIREALSVLIKYGNNAHLHIAGIGTINGTAAGNWLDSIGGTAASVGNQVGTVVNARSNINAVQATASDKPILRQASDGAYSWQFDGVSDHLTMSSSIFSNTAQLGISIAAAQPPVTAGNQFAISHRSPTTAAGVSCVLFSGGNPIAFWNDEVNSLLLTHSTSLAGQRCVVSAHGIASNLRTLRVNGVVSQTSSTILPAMPISNSHIGSSLRTSTPMSGFLDGHVYAACTIVGSVTAQEATILERFIGLFAKVQI